MIQRGSTGLCTTITQLIRRIADYHIKFHIEYLLRFDRMYPLISMGFQLIPSLIFALGRTAEQAFTVLPAVPVSAYIGYCRWWSSKKRDGILAVGILGTIHTSPGEKAGQLGDCDTIQLLCEKCGRTHRKTKNLILSFHGWSHWSAVSRRVPTDF